MRAKDQPRVSVLRILLDEFDDARKALGKQAFDAVNTDEPGIQPDRQQVLNEQTIQEIIRKELKRRQEFVDLLLASGQKEQAEDEEAEIAILEDYLAKI